MKQIKNKDYQSYSGYFFYNVLPKALTIFCFLGLIILVTKPRENTESKYSITNVLSWMLTPN